MSLTTSQLEDRVLAIEARITELETAINALATKTQLKQLVFLREQNQQALEGRVTTLESSISILQTS